MCSCEEIGARIKVLREEQKLTQSELATIMHTSRETINQWERGARDMKTGTVIALAKHFGVSCDYILTGVEAKRIKASMDLGLNNNTLKLLEVETSERLQAEKDGDRLEEFRVIGLDIPRIPDILNVLLDPDVGSVRVLRRIYEYLFFDFSTPYVQENGKDAEKFEKRLWFDVRTPRGKGMSPMSITQPMIEEAYLDLIKNDLRELKDERRLTNEP